MKCGGALVLGDHWALKTYKRVRQHYIPLLCKETKRERNTHSEVASRLIVMPERDFGLERVTRFEKFTGFDIPDLKGRASVRYVFRRAKKCPTLLRIESS